ncbi:carbohydrate ABC transporter permease [Paracraurococcus ruber]|uniref:ABC transporter permease n=1 Tax=Paracraurococcus ruber TaxID=77675 RepID=A0ABS1D0Q6_9PROT|nr:sugar ABC transporter permease [Paracraurococcus ruber]MBK1659687.1 ABC transporter permease [Paracraurococcus ruber]TDG29198.1 sugar ABC transporter permease [Paracraurococcus ruber]
MSLALGTAARPRLSAGAMEALAGWALMLPATIAFLAMLLLPTLATVLLAFTDYELGAAAPAWIGLANFADMLTDRGLRTSARNTLAYVGIVAPASVLGGLGLALLVEAGARGRAFFRAVFFLPVVSLSVAMASAWQYLLHPTIGPLNAELRALGLPTPFWLSSSDTVLLSLAAIGIWENIGFTMVLFMAGLTAIPRELYAAAAVDGARGAWDRFRLVTWPLLGPTTLFVVVISLVRALRVFDTVAVLTQGGPNKASEVLLWTMYQEGFTYLRLGYSAAITLVFLVVVLALMALQTRVLDRRVHYG